MFTVVKPEIFCAIPVSRKSLDISVSIEDGVVSFCVVGIDAEFCDSVTINNYLTHKEVCDLIDALEEVKSRMKVG